MIRLKEIKRKQIYLDDATLRNLRGLKAEREKRGKTQREMAERLKMSISSWREYERQKKTPILERYIRMSEYFGWDMKRNPNCVYYRMVKKHRAWNWLKEQSARYGYKVKELSKELGFSVSTVENVLYQYSTGSIHAFVLVYEAIRQEQKREKQREEMLKA